MTASLVFAPREPEGTVAIETDAHGATAEYNAMALGRFLMPVGRGR